MTFTAEDLKIIANLGEEAINFDELDAYHQELFIKKVEELEEMDECAEDYKHAEQGCD